MRHPGVARVKCADCQKWMYDLETGERSTMVVPGPDGEPQRLPIERPKNIPPPCVKDPEKGCPKESPEDEWKYVMNEANLQLVDLVRRCGSPGFELPEHLRGCKVWQENFAIVTETREGKQRADLLEAITLIALRK